MPGFTYAGTTSNNRSPAKLGYTLGKAYASSTAKGLVMAGDWVVLTTNTNHTASSYPVVRPLVAADKTAHYQQGTPIAGLLGVAEMGAQTDANGFASGPILPSGVATSAIPIYALPTVPTGYKVDPNIGYSRIVITEASGGNKFRGRLNTGSATAALSGTIAGLILAASGTVTTYTVDTSPSGGAIAGGDACLIITGWDSRDSLNTAVYCRVVGAFQQPATGINYTTAG